MQTSFASVFAALFLLSTAQGTFAADRSASPVLCECSKQKPEVWKLRASEIEDGNLPEVTVDISGDCPDIKNREEKFRAAHLRMIAAKEASASSPRSVAALRERKKLLDERSAAFEELTASVRSLVSRCSE